MIGKKNNLIHTPSNPCTKDVCFEVYRGEVCVAWYKGPASLLNVAEPGGSDLVAKARAESEDTLADLLSALRKTDSPLDIAKVASRFGALKITSSSHSLHRSAGEPLPLFPLGPQIIPASVGEVAEAMGGAPVRPKHRSAANRALTKYPAPKRATVALFHQSVGFYLDARDMVLLVGRFLLCSRGRGSAIRDEMEQIGVSFTPGTPANPETYDPETPSIYALSLELRSSEYVALARQVTTFNFPDDSFYSRPDGLADLRSEGSNRFRLEYKAYGEISNESHIRACEAMADALFFLHLLEVETYTTGGGYIHWNCKSLLGAMWFRLAEITTNGRVAACRVCGLPFFNDTERGSVQKYCSLSCQRAAQSKGIAEPRSKSLASAG